MTTKVEIVERLGEAAVLLPALIADALAANDRIKLGLSLLQEASAHAQAPERPVPQMETSGMPDVPANFVAAARLVDGDTLFAPNLRAVLASLMRDLAAMALPLRTKDSARHGDLLARAANFVSPPAEGDRILLAAVDALASARRDGEDSLHLIVMDLHKAIDALAAETAPETLDGASVHGLNESERCAVKAFMKGLNRTAPLAFGHPGLGTTAIHSGTRLTIENDIGATAAHVLVVHVDADEIAVTYTDVHRVRTGFFMSLFGDEPVDWTPLAQTPREKLGESAFYLVTGRFRYMDEARRDRFLEFLGSRIVFLIDWNRARKALQTFVGKKAAIGILLEAAKADTGHRAFLDLGGRELVYDTVQHVAAGRIPYGARLDAVLGDGECREFLAHVLRDTSQGLSAGRTARLIRDQIQADLARRFETAESAVLTILVRHLGLTRMLAESVADGISSSARQASRADLAKRAKRIEAKADRLTVSAREMIQRQRESGLLRKTIDEIENATDALEDCAFLLALLPDEAAWDRAPLVRLADTVVDGIGELVKAVAAAARRPQGRRADATASLQAIDAVIVSERTADDIERDALTALTAAPQADARILILGLEIARTLETATDHLSHAAFALRDRVLSELSA